MAEAGPGTAGGYVAFISYSHKDAAMGRWLHRKLEGYRLPKRLVGTEGEDGEVPERLTPIFRDRDELPAAGDLSARVRAALAVSRNLIVLCSPNSAASPWVAKEIATFRELNPGRPVFTAVVEGEPGQCFSPALLEGGVEPLAADLRKEGDGRRLGLLKLVAGLAGVGLDALVQRDAARRVRRVTYVTAAAIAGMLVMALSTAFALNARVEAERERVAAEGLVEFMLTDLRERLQAVGSLKAMETVNAQALKYYGSRKDLQRLGDESLARRARILHAIGDDNLARREMAAAMRAFAEARQTTAEQLARSPDEPERLFEHTKTDFGIGRVHELQGNWPLAQRHYGDFAAAAERLVATAPANPDYLMKAAASAIDLGNVALRGRDDPATAQRWYDRAIAWLNRAERVRPRDAHILVVQANAYAWRSDSFYDRKDWDRSLADRRIQFEKMQELAQRDPQDWEIKYRFAAARRGLAYSLAKTGQFTEAQRQVLAAHATTAELMGRDPGNAEWRQLHDRLVRDLRRQELGWSQRDLAARRKQDEMCRDEKPFLPR